MSTSFRIVIGYDGTGLYPNQITHPQTGSISHVEVPAYDSGTGELLSHKDENKNITYFSYDEMRRLNQTNYPDGGSETIQYNDSVPPSYIFTKAINSSTNFVETGIADTLGRESVTELNSDPDGITYTRVLPSLFLAKIHSAGRKLKARVGHPSESER